MPRRLEKGCIPPAISLLLLLATSTAANFADLSPSLVRSPHHCAIRDSCGSKGIFGGQIPCPDNGLAQKHANDTVYLSTLRQVCGDDFPTETCCTIGQLETLSGSLAQADPIISSCPACRTNFRQFYCHFTCSPSQSEFLTVTSTQTLKKDGKDREAVKSVDFAVSEGYGQGFFDSCRGVKFGATNGYAMDLIGGGATDYLSFLRYMGQERALGSPFQINFPSASSPLPPTTNGSVPAPVPLDVSAHSCASSDPNLRCACPDCPSTCAELPPILSPREKYERRCRVGKMDCFPFSLIIVYAFTLIGSVFFLVGREIRNRYGGQGSIKLPDIQLRGDEGGRRSGGYRGVNEEDDGAWNRLRNRLSFVGEAWRNSRISQVVGSDEPGVGREREGRIGGGGTLFPQSPEIEDPLAEDQEYDETPVPLSSSAAMRAGRSRSRSSGLVRGNIDGSPSSGTPSPRSSRRKGHRATGSTPSTMNDSSNGQSLFEPSFQSSTSTIPQQPRTYPLNNVLSQFFHSLGYFCAKRPLLTIFLGLLVCGPCNIGWKKFEVEKDPVRLWVPKGSTVAKEKDVFEENFGPFYRTEQLFFSLATPSTRLVDPSDDAFDVETEAWNPIDSPVLDFDTLEYILSVENHIRTLVSSPSNISLPSVCFAPASLSPESTNLEDCVVQSPLAYFQHSLEDADVNRDNWIARLDGCANSPASCLPTFGQPIEPKFVFGQAPKGEKGIKASQARAVVVTYVVRNSLEREEIRRAEEWEGAVESYLRSITRRGGEAAQKGLRIDWSTGRSLEEELNAATNTDVKIVVLSYLLMFAYVAFALGGSGTSVLRLSIRGVKRGLGKLVQKVRGGGAIRLEDENDGSRTRFEENGQVKPSIGAALRRKVLVESKVGLGLVGILLVLLSISTSVALLSLMRVRVTLIIAEVLPFLVLAIGVDNVFILSHELEEQNSRSRRIGGTVLLGEDDEDEDQGIEDRVARALGRMGPSILLSASCETAAFALGALVGMPAVRNFALYAAVATLINACLQITVFVSAMALDQRRIESNRLDCFPFITLPSTPSPGEALAIDAEEAPLQRFIRTVYAPNLLRKPVRYFVVALFAGLFVLSWIGARHVDLGLDQRLALPSSSYLVNYFNALDAYLDVGPPVYFVLRHNPHLPIEQISSVEKVCGRFSACEEYSVANVLEAERKRTDSSYLAEPPAVWIDDFVQWMNPLLEDCCRVKKRNTSEFCNENDSPGLCKPCFEDREPGWSTTLEGLPQGDEFMRFLNQWLVSPTDESCPLGGRASYSSALSLSEEQSTVEYSHIRTYHSPLKTQADFIEAFAAAKRIARDLEKRTGAEVFPYSLFYVFFSSYSRMWATTRLVLAFALLSIFLVTALLLGSFRTAAVVVLSVFLSVASVIGVMGVWSVSLNPLSLVNLVISAGIAVEFCAHVARSFMGANGGGIVGKDDRTERAFAALVDVGSSVISGILSTKIIGIVVLGFTRSKLLEVYYFRMWLSLILSGALHGLVFLPVALSLCGGQGYSVSSEDSWIASSLQERYENRPFRDDESDDEDELVA